MNLVERVAVVEPPVQHDLLDGVRVPQISVPGAPPSPCVS